MAVRLHACTRTYNETQYMSVCSIDFVSCMQEAHTEQSLVAGVSRVPDRRACIGGRLNWRGWRAK